MKTPHLRIALFFAAMSACTDDRLVDGETAEPSSSDGATTDADDLGTPGTRCQSAGDCNPGLECFTSFAGERPVCTVRCDAPEACPPGTLCIEGLIDASSEQPLPGYCMLPCSDQASCDALGSECDGWTGEADRYCL